MEQKLLTVKELAQYLGVNRFSVYRWVEQQKIPHRRVDRLIRFDLREVEEFMRRRPTVKIHAEDGR
jgi:excisionase family DNA binding protein